MNIFNPYIKKYKTHHSFFLIGFLIPFMIFFTIFYHILQTFLTFSLRTYMAIASMLFLSYLIYWVEKHLPNKHIAKERKSVPTVAFIQGFKSFGHTFANILNFVLLSLVYFMGVGITAIASKLLRKKFLVLKRDKNLKTYWEDLNLSTKEKESYYRQF